MINWFSMILIVAGVMAGAEIGRRRAEKKGQIVTRLSLSEYRFLNALSALGGVLFIELSRLALNQPSETHVWYVIGSATLAFVSFTVHLTRELNATKRELEELQASAG